MKTLLLTFILSLFTISNVLALDLQAAGATFPYPFYSKVFDEYYKKTGVKVNYQAIGSGGGIKQIFNQVVDFGASDKPVSDKELQTAPGKILHIPTCLGAVVITYNLPGVKNLKLDGETIVDIFLGKIKKWNDRRIKKLNKNIELPNIPIQVVHRADGSGTTFIFTDYLSSVSKDWANRVGKGKTVNWPTGIGAPQNAGVTAQIQKTKGAIGYVELAYATENHMPVVTIKNKQGEWIKPSLESISKAANIKDLGDTRVSLVNSSAKGAYPIASFTWLLVYEEQNYKNRSKEKAKATYNVIKYLLTDGQNFAEPLLYGRLPSNAQKKALEILNKLKYNGEPLK